MKTLLAALALTAVSLTGCTPATTPEVDIIDAITITAPESQVEVGEAATLEAEEVNVGEAHTLEAGGTQEVRR